METFSRQAHSAFVCGVAGPLAALAALHVLTPVVIGGTVEDPGYLGDWILGAILSLLILTGFATLAGLGATIAAFVLTRCPHLALAVATSVGATLAWGHALAQTELSLPACVCLLGLAPATVRLLFGVLPQAGLSAPTTHMAKNWEPPPYA